MREPGGRAGLRLNFLAGGRSNPDPLGGSTPPLWTWICTPVNHGPEASQGGRGCRTRRIGLTFADSPSRKVQSIKEIVRQVGGGRNTVRTALTPTNRQSIAARDSSIWLIRPNQPHESRLEPRETAPDATEAVCPWHQVGGRERRLRSAPRTEISADLLFQFGDIRGEFGRELAPDCWIQGGS